MTQAPDGLDYYDNAEDAIDWGCSEIGECRSERDLDLDAEALDGEMHDVRDEDSQSVASSLVSCHPISKMTLVWSQQDVGVLATC